MDKYTMRKRITKTTKKIKISDRPSLVTLLLSLHLIFDIISEQILGLFCSLEQIAELTTLTLRSSLASSPFMKATGAK